MKNLFHKIWGETRHVSGSRLQRFLAWLLSFVIIANFALIGPLVHQVDARGFFEPVVKKITSVVDSSSSFFADITDFFRSQEVVSPAEFQLVAVIVDDAVLDDALLARQVRVYCDSVQDAVEGSACIQLRWNGQSPSEIVESLQQLYFEGIEVRGGTAILSGVVLVGNVPLPVVHKRERSFVSIYPYIDLAQPRYVFDEQQLRFVETDAYPIAELWHGVIRSPREGDEGLQDLKSFFAKNEAFHTQNLDQIAFSKSIGVNDQIRENQVFNNQVMQWYLKKQNEIENLVHFRYTKELANKLMNAGTQQLEDLQNQTFPGSPVSPQRTTPTELLSAEGAPASLSGSSGASSETPDPATPAIIRGLLKDYYQVVSRSVAEAQDAIASVGRNHDPDILPVRITKKDRHAAATIKIVTDKLEDFLLAEAYKIGEDVELVSDWEYTDDGMEERKHARFVNGKHIALVQSAEDCSVFKGTHDENERGETGKHVESHRADGLGQQIARENEEYQRCVGDSNGNVRACDHLAQRSLLDLGAGELADLGSVLPFDYRQCYLDENVATPRPDDRIFQVYEMPEDVDKMYWHKFTSAIEHNEPDGVTVAGMMKSMTASNFPVDVKRFVSFFLGGVEPLRDDRVGRIDYPNFFPVNLVDGDAIRSKIAGIVESIEVQVRKMRVEANWQRFMRYLAVSTHEEYRRDFWEVGEIPGFAARFDRYRSAVEEILRQAYGSGFEGWEYTEKWLMEPDSLEQSYLDHIELSRVTYFPTEVDIAENSDRTGATPSQVNEGKIQKQLFVDPIGIGSMIMLGGGQGSDGIICYPELPSVEGLLDGDASLRVSCPEMIKKTASHQFDSLADFYKQPSSNVLVSLQHKWDKKHVLNFSRETIGATGVLLATVTTVCTAAALLSGGVSFLSCFQGSSPLWASIVGAFFIFDLIDARNQGSITEHWQVDFSPVVLSGSPVLGELVTGLEDQLVEAIRWKNLGIELKHKEAFREIIDDKELAYVMMGGDNDVLDFTLDRLDFYDDDSGQAEDPLEVVERMNQQLLDASGANRTSSGVCPDSVDLLKWPAALVCWFEEELSPPFIIPPGGEEEDNPSVSTGGASPLSHSSQSFAGSSTGENGGAEVIVDKPVLALGDPALVRVQGASQVLSWEVFGNAVLSQLDAGSAVIIPSAEGQVIVKVKVKESPDSAERVLEERISVVSSKAFIGLSTILDSVQIDADEEITLWVEVRDVQGNVQDVDLNLDVEFEHDDALTCDGTCIVAVNDGVGKLTLSAGTVAGLVGVRVGVHSSGSGSTTSAVAFSNYEFVNVLAGEIARISSDFGDGIVGNDDVISGVLRSLDQYGNLVKGEVVRVHTSFEGAIVNGDDSGEKAVFILSGEGAVEIEIDDRDKLAFSIIGIDGYDLSVLDNPSAPQSGASPLAHASQSFAGSLTGENGLLFEFDLGEDYQVGFVSPSSEKRVQEVFPLDIRIDDGQGGLVELHHKVFEVKVEQAGRRSTFQVPFDGTTASVGVPIGRKAGNMTIAIDDDDFGEVSHEVLIKGGDPYGLAIDVQEKSLDEVAFSVRLKDVFGNLTSTDAPVQTHVTIIENGGNIMWEDDTVLLGEKADVQAVFPKPLDRIKIIAEADSLVEARQLERIDVTFNDDDIRGMEWNSPYLVLGGNDYGSYLKDDPVAYSFLYGEDSKIQAVTTEVSPSLSERDIVRALPSGKVVPFDDQVQLDLLLGGGKSEVVASNRFGEIGRLSNYHPWPSPELVNALDTSWQWRKRDGEGRVQLILGDAEGLRDSEGFHLVLDRERLFTFMADGTLRFDSGVKFELLSDEQNDALVFDMKYQGALLATVYYDSGDGVVRSEGVDGIVWTFAYDAVKIQYGDQNIYTGFGTDGDMGLRVFMRGEKERTGLGFQRSGIDDTVDEVSVGWSGEDKSLLLYGAGNSVGLSMLKQPDNVINLGDPTISLDLMKQRTTLGAITDIFQNPDDDTHDFTVGQHLYSTQQGDDVQYFLNADVNLDGNEDVLFAVGNGQEMRVRYLEKDEIGKSYGDVSDLLLIRGGRSSIKRLSVLDGVHVLVLYEDGSLSVEQNIEGRYVKRELILPSSDPEFLVDQLKIVDLDADGQDDLVVMDGAGDVWGFYGIPRDLPLTPSFGRRGDLSLDTEETRNLLQFEEGELLGSFGSTMREASEMVQAGWVHFEGSPEKPEDCVPDSSGEYDDLCKAPYFRERMKIPLPVPAGDDAQISEFTRSFDDRVAEWHRDIAASLSSGTSPEEPSLLVRLDKTSLASGMSFTYSGLSDDRRLKRGEEFELEVRMRSARQLRDFEFFYDLGAAFGLSGPVSCTGCDETGVRLVTRKNHLFGLMGQLPAGRDVIITVPIKIKALPTFFINSLYSNEDDYPDVSVSVGSNNYSIIESRGVRSYEVIAVAPEETPVTENTFQTELQQLQAQMTQAAEDEDVALLQQLSQQMESLIGISVESLQNDVNGNGYPDFYEETPVIPPVIGPPVRSVTAIPNDSTPSTQDKPTFDEVLVDLQVQVSDIEQRMGAILQQIDAEVLLGNGTVSLRNDLDVLVQERDRLNRAIVEMEKLIKDEDGSPRSFLDWIVPSAHAQVNDAQSNAQISQDATAATTEAMADTQAALDDIEGQVSELANMLQCTKGCLPMPINFAFLAAGFINANGVPVGIDYGTPAIAFPGPAYTLGVPVPFLPNLAHPLSTTRIYLAPTLTLGLGLAVCIGPPLGKLNCAAFSIPHEVPGTAELCDAFKQGVQSILGTITEAAGDIRSAAEGALASTGVVKPSNAGLNDSEISTLLDIDIGSKPISIGPIDIDPKITLAVIPPITEWVDSQFEEIVNSLTDLPDITVRVPVVSALYAAGSGSRIAAKADQIFSVEGAKQLDTFDISKWYDLINSLPLVTVNPRPVRVVIPWIEAGIIEKMLVSLIKFLNEFMLEVINFLDSFEIICHSTPIRNGFVKRVRENMMAQLFALEKKSEKEAQVIVQVDEEISALKKKLDSRGYDNFERLAKEDLKHFFDAHPEITPESQASINELVDDMKQKLEDQKDRKEKLADLRFKLSQSEDPESLGRTANELVTYVQTVGQWWKEDTKDSNNARLAGYEAAQCLGKKVALNLSLDIGDFLSFIVKNLETLQQWKRFPRQLAKYLNILDFYVQQVGKILDQIIGQFVKWWAEFNKRLNKWFDAIYSFYELVALIKTIRKIFEDYNMNCSLCKSDRLTLKDLLVKLLFGAIPEIPVIPFPTWPDIVLDFSRIQANMSFDVPVFKLSKVNIVWPGLPSIQLPRFPDFDFKLGLNFSFKLPSFDFEIPPPPVLPPLPQFQLEVPQFKIPNLPPAPEIPDFLSALMPIMKLIQTALNIVCLIQRSIIPVDEVGLKSQIENLTNRSMHLILPLDLLLSFKLDFGQFLPEVVPFDLIRVQTLFEGRGGFPVAVDELRATLDEDWNQPMEQMVEDINSWTEQLKFAGQQGLGALTSDFQEWLDQYEIEDFNAQAGASFEVTPDGKAQGGAAAGGGSGFDAQEIQRELDELFNTVPQVDRFYAVKDQLSLYGESLRGIRRGDTGAELDLLAALESDHSLVSTGAWEGLIDYRAEKMVAMGDAMPVREFYLSMIDKDLYLSGLEEVTLELSSVSGSASNLAPSAQDLGVMITEGDTYRRLQSYQVDPDDMQVEVQDDSIFTAYEGDVFVKRRGSERLKGLAYTGNSLRGELSDYGKNKTHLLKAETLSATVPSELSEGKIRYRWLEGVSSKLELEVWDSVMSAQHESDRGVLRRYMVDRVQPDVFDQWILLDDNGEVERLIVDGEVFAFDRDRQFVMGTDILVVEDGVSVEFASSVSRDLVFTGNGDVDLLNVSGEAYLLSLEGNIDFSASGFLAFSVSGEDGSVLPVIVPGVQEVPFMARTFGDITGKMVKRDLVAEGETLSVGRFYGFGEVTLENREGYRVDLPTGFLFQVSDASEWTLHDGEGEVMADESDDLVIVDVEGDSQGRVLVEGDRFEGVYTVRDGPQSFEVSENELLEWKYTDGAEIEIDVPEGYYYSRIHERYGQWGDSPIILGLSERGIPKGDVLPGPEYVRVPMYVPLSIDAKDYTVGIDSPDSYAWEEVYLDNDRFIFDAVWSHEGFAKPGRYELKLHVRNGLDEVHVKKVFVDVFVPQVRLEESTLSGIPVLKGRLNVSERDIPVGLIAERDGVRHWVENDTLLGEILESGSFEFGDPRYETDFIGEFALESFAGALGQDIVIDDGDRVARVYPNGRVVLYPSYRDSCRTTLRLDDRNFVQSGVECHVDILVTVTPEVRQAALRGDGYVSQFEVQLVPPVDTDVLVVDHFLGGEIGVSVRKALSSVQIIELSGSGAFMPGGVQVNSEGGPILFISTYGEILALSPHLRIEEKPYGNLLEPVVFQIMREVNEVLVEVQIRPSSEQVEIEGERSSSSRGTMPVSLNVYDRNVSYESSLSNLLSASVALAQGSLSSSLPLDYDLDQDGMLDAWERSYGIDDPFDDPDGDAITNIAEFRAGTDPIEGAVIVDLPERDRQAVYEEHAQRVSAALPALKEYAFKQIFDDVDASHPYFDAVQGLFRLGFIQGNLDQNGERTYRVRDSITRAESVKILMSIVNCENCEFPTLSTREEYDSVDDSWNDIFDFHGVEVNNEQYERGSLEFGLGLDEVVGRLGEIGSYYDVPASEWFYYCVEIATKLGIVNGYRGTLLSGENAIGSFQPALSISRAELTKMILESIGVGGVDLPVRDRIQETVTYENGTSEVKEWSKGEYTFGPKDAWWNDPDNNYMLRAKQFGLFQDSEVYVHPEVPATRGEVADATWRVFDTIRGNIDSDDDGYLNQDDFCPCITEGVVYPGEYADGCPFEFEDYLRTLLDLEQPLMSPVPDNPDEILSPFDTSGQSARSPAVINPDTIIGSPAVVDPLNSDEADFLDDQDSISLPSVDDRGGVLDRADGTDRADGEDRTDEVDGVEGVDRTDVADKANMTDGVDGVDGTDGDEDDRSVSILDEDNGGEPGAGPSHSTGSSLEPGDEGPLDSIVEDNDILDDLDGKVPALGEDRDQDDDFAGGVEGTSPSLDAGDQLYPFVPLAKDEVSPLFGGPASDPSGSPEDENRPTFGGPVPDEPTFSPERQPNFGGPPVLFLVPDDELGARSSHSTGSSLELGEGGVVGGEDGVSEGTDGIDGTDKTDEADGSDDVDRIDRGDGVDGADGVAGSEDVQGDEVGDEVAVGDEDIVGEEGGEGDKGDEYITGEVEKSREGSDPGVEGGEDSGDGVDSGEAGRRLPTLRDGDDDRVGGGDEEAFDKGTVLFDDEDEESGRGVVVIEGGDDEDGESGFDLVDESDSTDRTDSGEGDLSVPVSGGEEEEPDQGEDSPVDSDSVVSFGDQPPVTGRVLPRIGGIPVQMLSPRSEIQLPPEAVSFPGIALPLLLEVAGEVYECADDEDNDGDGLTDKEDPSCWDYFNDGSRRFNKRNLEKATIPSEIDDVLNDPGGVDDPIDPVEDPIDDLDPPPDDEPPILDRGTPPGGFIDRPKEVGDQVPPILEGDPVPPVVDDLIPPDEGGDPIPPITKRDPVPPGVDDSVSPDVGGGPIPPIVDKDPVSPVVDVQVSPRVDTGGTGGPGDGGFTGKPGGGDLTNRGGNDNGGGGGDDVGDSGNTGGGELTPVVDPVDPVEVDDPGGEDDPGGGDDPPPVTVVDPVPSIITVLQPTQTLSEVLGLSPGWSGVFVTPTIACRCIGVEPSDPAKDTVFYAVITGVGDEERKVYAISNRVVIRRDE